jgi:hypothetical protein
MEALTGCLETAKGEHYIAIKNTYNFTTGSLAGEVSISGLGNLCGDIEPVSSGPSSFCRIVSGMFSLYKQSVAHTWCLSKRQWSVL